jgi:hypothetical protein
MRFRKPEPINLLELKPERVVEWETADDGLVVLLIPKFRNPFMVQWILPMLQRRVFRVKLDAYGSFVWRHCDGSTPVAQMGERMKGEFGEAAEPVFERIGKFLNKLEREEFVRIHHHQGSAVAGSA